MITKLTTQSMQQIVQDLSSKAENNRAKAQKELSELTKRHKKIQEFAGGGVFNNFGKQILNFFEELYNIAFTDIKWSEATFYWSDKKIIQYLTDEAVVITDADTSTDDQIIEIVNTIKTTASKCLSSINKNELLTNKKSLEDLINTISSKALLSKTPQLQQSIGGSVSYPAKINELNTPTQNIAMVSLRQQNPKETEDSAKQQEQDVTPPISQEPIREPVPNNPLHNEVVIADETEESEDSVSINTIGPADREEDKSNYPLVEFTEAPTVKQQIPRTISNTDQEIPGIKETNIHRKKEDLGPVAAIVDKTTVTETDQSLEDRTNLTQPAVTTQMRKPQREKLEDDQSGSKQITQENEQNVNGTEKNKAAKTVKKKIRATRGGVSKWKVGLVTGLLASIGFFASIPRQSPLPEIVANHKISSLSNTTYFYRTPHSGRPEFASGYPIPTQGMIEPPPTQGMIAPPPAREMIAPPPTQEMIAPPPAREMIEPPPTQGMIAPPPAREMIAPPPTQEMIAPPPAREMIEPPPAREMIAPPPAREMIAPPPAREMIAPPPTQEMIEPPPTQEMIEPPPTQAQSETGNSTILTIANYIGAIAYATLWGRKKTGSSPRQLRQEGLSMLRKGRVDDALDKFIEAQDIEKVVVIASRYQASGDYEKALECYKKTLHTEVPITTNNLVILTNKLITLGNSFESKNKLQYAFECYFIAHDISTNKYQKDQSTDNLANVYKLIKATKNPIAYLWIGKLHNESGKRDESEGAFRLAYQELIKEEASNDPNIRQYLMEIGEFFLHLGKVDMPLLHQPKLSLSSEDVGQMAMPINEIPGLENFRRAKECFQKSNYQEYLNKVKEICNNLASSLLSSDPVDAMNIKIAWEYYALAENNTGLINIVKNAEFEKALVLQDNPTLFNQLGNIYLAGSQETMLEPNPEKAIIFLLSAAFKGNKEARATLRSIEQHGTESQQLALLKILNETGSEQKPPLRLLYNMTRKGQKEAVMQLIDIWNNNQGLFEAAPADILIRMGDNCYEVTDKSKPQLSKKETYQQLKKALTLYQKAFEKDNGPEDPELCMKIAEMHANGYGTLVDSGKAQEYYIAALSSSILSKLEMEKIFKKISVLCSKNSTAGSWEEVLQKYVDAIEHSKNPMVTEGILDEIHNNAHLKNLALNNKWQMKIAAAKAKSAEILKNKASNPLFIATTSMSDKFFGGMPLGTNDQLEKLSEACTKDYSSSSSIKNMIARIEKAKASIEEDFQIALEANKTYPDSANTRIRDITDNAIRLAEITHTFRSHCPASAQDVEQEKSALRLWATNIVETCKNIAKSQIPTKTTLDDDSYKKKLDSLPDASEFAKCSLQELLKLEKQQRNLIVEIPPTIKKSLTACWDQLWKITENIQRKSIECTDLLPSSSSVYSPPSVKTMNLCTSQNATSILALMNLGSLETASVLDDHEELVKNSQLTLSFTIKALELMLDRNEIPASEIAEVEKLLASYKGAYRIVDVQEEALRRASMTGTAEAFNAAKKEVTRTIVQELEARDEITLSTGYTAAPAGHEIAIRFIATTGTDGKRYVQGIVINRGEGVNYHGGEIQQGTTERVIPFLDLGTVSLDELAASPFLELLTELKILGLPSGKVLNLKDKTFYTIQDFYDVALPEWPGKFPAQVKEQMVRGAQRGPSCSLKAYLTPFRERFSPELARYMKLKMRIDALELYLHHGKLNEASIPFLEWSIKKINRTLEKLETQPSLAGGYPEWLKTQLESQGRYCALLTDYVNTKIHQIKEANLIGPTVKVVYDPDIVDVRETTEGIGTATKGMPKIDLSQTHAPPAPLEKEIEAPPLSFRSPAEAVAYINEIYNLGNKSDNNSKQIYLNCIHRCFAALPSVSNTEFWTSGILTEKQKIRTIELCPIHILDLLQFRLYGLSFVKQGKPLQITGRHVAELANTTAGILIALRQSKMFEEEYIQYKASRLLGVLETAASQIRTGHPNDEQRFKAALSEIRSMSKGIAVPLTLRKDTSIFSTEYVYEQVPCYTPEEQRDDIVLRHLIMNKPENQSTNTIINNYPYYHTEAQELDAVMVSFDGPLLLAVGLSFNAQYRSLVIYRHVTKKKEQYETEIAYRDNYNYDYKFKDRMESFRDISPHRKDLDLSRYGVLADELYPWSDEERLIVQEFLDHRLPFREEDRRTQNEQVKASRKSVRFGNAELHPDEIERLLSISSSSETLIPQCIHCFSLENSFGRLKDPRFQALLQGFLLARTPNGEDALLATSLKNPLLATALLAFLKQGIDRAGKEEWLETRLFLTFLLTQVIAFLPKDASPDVTDLAEKVLNEAIVHLPGEKLSPREKNICDHWLAAMLPLTSETTSGKVKEVCREACERLNQTYSPYDFNGRLMIKESFKKGMEQLSSGPTTLKTELPRWVFEHPDYQIVNDNEPKKVTFIKDGEFQIVTKKNETFTIRLIGKNEIKIYKQFKNLQCEEQNYLYFPKVSVIEPHFLIRDTSCWVNEKTHEALYVSKNNGSLNCRVLNDTVIHPTNPQLVLAELDPKIPVAERFLKLGDEGSVIAWKDKVTNKIERIELKNYNLSFEKFVDQNKQIKWRCPDQRNMEVDFDAAISELTPCSHYLVLKKGHEKYVLVTNKVVLPQKLPFTTIRNVKMGAAEDPKIFLYPVNEKGTLDLPQDPERLLYLIHISLRNHKYTETRELLKRLDNLHAIWSSKEKEMVGTPWLELIGDSGQEPVSLHKEQDMHPLACALRIRLRLMAERSGSFQNKVPFSLRALVEDYFVCLNHINSLGEVWLSLAEEEQALELILPKSEYVSQHPITILEARSDAISDQLRDAQSKQTVPNQSIKITATSDQPMKERLKEADLERVIQFNWVNLEIRKKMLECSKEPMEIGIKLRPGDNFVYNFLHYYKIAYNKKPEKDFQQLMELLRFSRNGMDPEVECIRRILLNVILSEKTPESPPTPDAMIASINEEPKIKRSYGDQCFENQCYWLFIYFNKNKLKEFDWGLAHKFDEPPVLTGRLQPKESIVLLKASSPSATIGHVILKKEEEPDYLTTAIKKDMVAVQGVPAQKAAIQKEIADLENIIAVYATKGQTAGRKKMRGRVIEGLQERIAGLKLALQKPEPSYILPVVAAAKQHHDVQERAAKQLGDTEKWIEDQINILGKETSELEIQLLNAANKRSLSLQREVAAGLIEPLSKEQLLVCFARGQEDIILKSNPELAGPQFAELKNLVKTYLVAKTSLQHFMRSQEALGNAIRTASREHEGWAAQTSRNAADAFIATLFQKRSYNPAEDFRLLVFEALSDIRLREDQCDALKKLSGLDKGGDFELEARTGFGKTKVVVPLWLLLNNQPGRILTFTTTASLFNDQVSYLRSTLGNAFDMSFQVVDFDKEKADDLGYLIWLGTQIESAKTNGRILLQPIGTLHGITGLALKQRLLKTTPGEKSSHTGKLLAIRKHYKTAFNFIDESAQCLNVRQGYDYASGKPKMVPKDHCRRAVDFYRQVVLHSSVISTWHFEFLPEAESSTAKQVPTQDNYDKALRPALVEAALKYLNVPPNHQDAVRDHLLGKDAKKAKAYFDSLNPVQKESYDYCHDQISSHLKKTLIRYCGARYDCGKNRLAIPYEDGVPKPSNEFSTVDDLIDFTIQANLKRPFENNIVEKYAIVLQEAFLKESAAALKQNPSYQLFLRLKKALPLSSIQELNQEDFKKIAAYLNSPEHLNDRLDFIACQILPQIRTLPHKISGNTYTLLRSLGVVHAASGTVKPDTMPLRMKTLEKKSALTGNLLALWKNSQHEILTIPTADPKAFLKELVAKRPKDRVLIDVGGTFRDLSQKEIVDLIFEQTASSEPPVNGITFYDDERRCMIWERGAKEPISQGESKMSPQEIYTYIRQGHAIGSDTPMTENAEGSVTVSRETVESFFLQGIGRMRGLSTGQTANLVINQEDARVICKQLGLPEDTKLQLPHILKYVQLLEVRQSQKDYYFALQIYLKELIESKLWEALNKKVILQKDLSRAFHVMKELLTEETERAPFAGLFDELLTVSAETAVARLKEETLSHLKKILVEHPELEKVFKISDIESEFDRFVDLEKLPETISVGEAGTKETISETESERSEETTEEVTVEAETEQSVSSSGNFIPASPISWDGDYRSQMASPDQQEHILGIPVVRSPNLLRLEQDKSSENRFRKPAYQYVLKIDPKGIPSLLALDLFDMGVVLNKMKTTETDETAGRFYLLSNNRIIGVEGARQQPIELNAALKDPAALAKIAVITRILGGSGAFSKNEYRWLKKENSKLTIVEQASLTHLLKDTNSAWPHQNKMMDQWVEMQTNPFSLKDLPKAPELPKLPLPAAGPQTKNPDGISKDTPVAKETELVPPAKVPTGTRSGLKWSTETQSLLSSSQPAKDTTNKNEPEPKGTKGPSQAEEFVQGWSASPDNRKRMLAFLSTQSAVVRDLSFLSIIERNLQLNAYAKAIEGDSMGQQEEAARQHATTLSEEFLKHQIGDHFDLVKCKADGDCLYEAIGIALGKEKSQVRKDAAGFMRKNKVELKKNVYLQLNVNDTEYEHLVKCVERDARDSLETTGWGTMRDIYIMALLYKRPMNLHSHIFKDETGKYRTEMLNPTGSTLPPIELFYDGTGHWDLLTSKV